MTANLAAAMFDWTAPASTAQHRRGKIRTYSTLNPPYLCKDGPLRNDR